MESNIQVVINPEIYLMQIQKLQEEITLRDIEIARLSTTLEYERQLREDLMRQYGMTPDRHNETAKKTRKRRDVKPETNTYSDFKSDGKRKAHAADSIRSYDDFIAIQQYYLDKGSIRDWAMWTVGVSLGLRISDLLSLKWRHVLNKDSSFCTRLQIYEQKTGKSNSALITESVKLSLTRLLEAIKYRFDLDDYIFPSRKTGGKMYEEYGWKILSDAGKALNLPFTMGSHTMRKSFANIAACVDKSCVDMNSITKVQGLLNHSDQRITMKYLGAYQDMFDRARVAVSDFVLGKTGVNEIVAGNQYTIDDIFERVESLERTLQQKGTLNEQEENE